MAFTMVEILVVAAIASAILGTLMMIWMRTGKTTARANEMMNLQLAAKNINEKIRNDIRTLSEIKTASEKRFEFVSLSKNGKIEIIYEFQPELKTLIRKAAGKIDNFNCPGMVNSISFSCLPTLDQFERLQMIIELASPGQHGSPSYSMAQVTEFSSRSIVADFMTVQ